MFELERPNARLYVYFFGDGEDGFEPKAFFTNVVVEGSGLLGTLSGLTDGFNVHTRESILVCLYYQSVCSDFEPDKGEFFESLGLIVVGIIGILYEFVQKAIFR